VTALGAESIIRPQAMPALRAKLSLGSARVCLPKFGNPPFNRRFDILRIGLKRPQNIRGQAH
jgi:hypothetical protein